MILPHFTDLLVIFFVVFGPTKLHRKCNFNKTMVSEDPYFKNIIPSIIHVQNAPLEIARYKYIFGRPSFPSSL